MCGKHRLHYRRNTLLGTISETTSLRPRTLRKIVRGIWLMVQERSYESNHKAHAEMLEFGAVTAPQVTLTGLTITRRTT